MNRGTEQDREMLNALQKEKLLDLFFLHIRNLWRVDGLYFLGIEEKFGTDAATQIDADCWKLIGQLEAKELKKTFGFKEIDVAALLNLLTKTSWALDQTNKEVEVSRNRGIFRVVKCRTQETRIRKGLDVFPCKKVRFDYLKSFAKELNPQIEVECKVCPPDQRPDGFWCEWEFKLRSI
ncbi:MAG: DUF6125 family protein [Candidatus Bathyarchaeota archaeon]|nr:DUF6125 family protein [Candidatus Bathyarchaeota archaeon]